MKWRLGEGRAQYMTRTAISLQRWFSMLQVAPLHIRILREVYRHAWREISFPSPSGSNTLAEVRKFRDRTWWESVCALQSARKRKLAGHCHAGLGSRVEWEDVFVAAYGARWRDRRDQCTSLSMWMHSFSDFSQMVCLKWGLHNATQPKAEIAKPPRPMKRAKTNLHPLEQLPEQHGTNAPVLVWEYDCGSFCFITDCQPVAGVTNGHTKLTNNSLAPVFQRIARRLFSMLDRGWGLSTCGADPVIWRRRDFNQIADYLVNHTMDMQHSWFQRCTPPIESFGVSGCNLIIHFDGGTRAGNCSASAWYIEARVLHQGVFILFPLVMGGTYVEEPISSFLAESLAFDEASELLLKMLPILEKPTGAAKRPRIEV